jgi:glycosyltransferase involved in cell wall biosynthesis
MNPLVSIVLPVYNGEKYLKVQVASITEQSYRNIELIIIDDDSMDMSLEMAKALAKADTRIQVYKNSNNLGIVLNFIKGLTLAKGEYICFSDQDDYWRNDKIDILKRLLQESKQNMLAYSDLEICDDKLQCLYPSFFKYAGIKPKKGYIGELFFLKNIVPGCAMMFRKETRDALIKIHSAPPFMHDHLALVVSSGLGKIVYSKEKLIKYRQHDKNNIEVFRKSVINKETILMDLSQKLEYFKTFSFEGLNLSLDKMQDFCECLRNGNIFTRLLFINSYLFLRNDTFKDKTLGIFECLSPRLYAWLRTKIKGGGSVKLPAVS